MQGGNAFLLAMRNVKNSQLSASCYLVGSCWNEVEIHCSHSKYVQWNSETSVEAACKDILEASFSSPVGVSYHTSKNYPAFFCITYLQGNTKVIVHEGFLLGMCVCFSSLQFTTRTPVGKTQKCKSEQIRGHYWPLLRQTKSVKKLSQS